MKALTSGAELESLSRRVTCTDCGTTYMQPPARISGLTCFNGSIARGAVLYFISQSGVGEAVIKRPRLQEVAITGVGLLVLGFMSLAFPIWYIAQIVGRGRRKLTWPTSSPARLMFRQVWKGGDWVVAPQIPTRRAL